MITSNAPSPLETALSIETAPSIPAQSAEPRDDDRDRAAFTETHVSSRGRRRKARDTLSGESACLCGQDIADEEAAGDPNNLFIRCRKDKCVTKWVSVCPFVELNYLTYIILLQYHLRCVGRQYASSLWTCEVCEGDSRVGKRRRV